MAKPSSNGLISRKRGPNMRQVTFQELSQDYLNQLVKGAFLTVKHAGKVNTMTIGWGTLGYMWNKHIHTNMYRNWGVS